MSNWWTWRRWRADLATQFGPWTKWHIEAPSIGQRRSRCGVFIYSSTTGHNTIKTGEPAPPEHLRCKRCIRGLRPDTMNDVTAITEAPDDTH